MELNAARDTINQYLKAQFGKVTTLREVAVERSTSGRVFVGSVYCVTQKGDIHIGSVGISEEGDIVRPLEPDMLVNALFAAAENSDRRSIVPVEREPEFSLLDDDDLGDLDGAPEERPSLLDEDDMELEGDELDQFFSEFNDVGIMGNIIGLLTSGDKADLLKARRLMPQLLVDHEKRGTVLLYMGDLEIRLDEKELGLDYLEAAAREFADVGDVESLSRTVAAASRVLAKDALEEHATHKLLEQTMARQTAIETLEETPLLSGMSEANVEKILQKAETVTVPAGQTILKEGTPATQAFIIMSGILGINLETPGGSARTVRCCFPGELVGESCVQGEGATCNATVFAKQDCTLWRFSGSDLTRLIDEIPELKSRLDTSRTIHRLDSFFSMNEVTNTLHVRVRDRIIGCISAIRHVKEGEIIERRDTQPRGVYLLATGRIEKQFPEDPPRVYPPDSFVCLKETLHKLPLEGDVIAKAPSRLVVFDTDALFELAIGAPPEVVAVLERLE